jgi:hypothetical protein
VSQSGGSPDGLWRNTVECFVACGGDLRDHEERRGLSPDQAIHQACLHRFRPILMTTMSALLGAFAMSDVPHI